MRWMVMLLVAAALMTGQADAQPGPWRPERLTPGWVFTPTMALGGLWDSNVTLRNQGNPLLSEWVGTVSPRGEMDYNGRHFRFNTGYSGALEAYSRFSELNRYEQRARVSTQYRATPRLQTQAQASYTATPTTDRLELGTLPFIDIGARSFDAGGGATLSLSPRTQLIAEYQFQHITFDRDENRQRNVLLEGGYSHAPLARVTYSLTSRLGVGGQWQYRRATIGGGAENFNVQTMLGEVNYKVAEATSVFGAAGASHLDISSTDVDMWGPSFRAGLEHEIERTSVTFGYARSFVPSFSFGGLTANQEVSLGVRTPLTRGGRLELTGSVSYTSSEPVEELGVGFGLDSLWTNVSLGYGVAPWLRTEAFLSTMHQTSTARGNIDRTRIGFQFVTFKPVRIQ
jgi:hypothetical protein